MNAEPPDAIGEYQIQGVLGEGAVARVYAGRDPKSGRQVAIKVLREGHNPEYRTVERFIAEVRAVKQIRHHNIIEIYSFGMLPDGRPYFVMEYQPGMTLQKRIDRDGPLTFLEAAPIFIQACDALTAAHANDIVHRDLKPDNIYLMDQPGGPPLVKLLDFGIAKLTSQQQASAALTQVGSTVGTPLYMSPEQIRAQSLDARSDIYTLGVSLFQALTGEFPFYADSHAQTAMMHLSKAPPRPSEVYDLLPIPVQAEEIVLRCLEKSPERRFGSASELRQALEDAIKELMATRQLSGSRELRTVLPSVPPRPAAGQTPAPATPGGDTAAPPVERPIAGPAAQSPPSSAPPTLVTVPSSHERITQPMARQPVPGSAVPVKRAQRVKRRRDPAYTWLWVLLALNLFFLTLYLIRVYVLHR